MIRQTTTDRALLALAQRIAALPRYRRPRVDVDELRTAALVKMVPLWNEGVRDEPLLATAGHRGVLDHLRTRFGRTEQAAARRRSFTEVEMKHFDSGEPCYDLVTPEATTDNLDVAILLGSLSPRTRRIAERHFLLDHTLLDIAIDEGLTEARISQICTAALRRLRAVAEGREARRPPPDAPRRGRTRRPKTAEAVPGWVVFAPDGRAATGEAPTERAARMRASRALGVPTRELRAERLGVPAGEAEA